MQDDANKNSPQLDEARHAADKIEELPEKPISNRDAESIKGGQAVLHDDESPK
jgi:hypothetical protein